METQWSAEEQQYKEIYESDRKDQYDIAKTNSDTLFKYLSKGPIHDIKKDSENKVLTCF